MQDRHTPQLGIDHRPPESDYPLAQAFLHLKEHVECKCPMTGRQSFGGIESDVVELQSMKWRRKRGNWFLEVDNNSSAPDRKSTSEYKEGTSGEYD